MDREQECREVAAAIKQAKEAYHVRAELRVRLAETRRLLGEAHDALVDNKGEIRATWRRAHPEDRNETGPDARAAQRQLRYLNRARARLHSTVDALVLEREWLLRLLGASVARLMKYADAVRHAHHANPGDQTITRTCSGKLVVGSMTTTHTRTIEVDKPCPEAEVQTFVVGTQPGFASPFRTRLLLTDGPDLFKLGEMTLTRAQLQELHDQAGIWLRDGNPEPDPRVTAAEAVFAFAAWLTMRDHAVTLGSVYYAGIAADLAKTWCDVNKLDAPRDGVYPHNIQQPSSSWLPAVYSSSGTGVAAGNAQGGEPEAKEPAATPKARG